MESKGSQRGQSLTKGVTVNQNRTFRMFIGRLRNIRNGTIASIIAGTIAHAILSAIAGAIVSAIAMVWIALNSARFVEQQHFLQILPDHSHQT